jgi:DNA-binding transcriptional ArsR family regulator
VTGNIELDPTASPLHTFSALIARTANDLGTISFVAEWIGPGERVPVFDTASLRDFAHDTDRRIFLAELLASYTHVASGQVWSRSAGRWRKHRYSELDPLWLAELVEALPEPERGAALRRLGDLALFLGGVFPDHAARNPIEPRHLARIVRAIEAGGGPVGAPPFAGGAFSEGGITTLEWLGRVSYRLAEASTGGGDILPDVAARFVDARRFLNVLTDRYLFPLRERWFPVA